MGVNAITNRGGGIFRNFAITRDNATYICSIGYYVRIKYIKPLTIVNWVMEAFLVAVHSINCSVLSTSSADLVATTNPLTRFTNKRLKKK